MSTNVRKEVNCQTYFQRYFVFKHFKYEVNKHEYVIQEIKWMWNLDCLNI